MSFNHLRAIWQRRIARAAVGLLVLAGAAFAQYKLANVPRPVSVETVENFSPATIKPGQELVIEGAMAEGALFSHDGKQNETVDINFDRARLDEQTIALFENFGLKPPSTPVRIDYQAQEQKKPSTGDESCRTRVELRTTSQTPAEIHLFQLADPGLERYRHLGMKMRGAELVSNMLTTTPGESDLAPGCQKLLRVGDWTQSLPPLDITAIAAEGSILRFNFRPLKADTSLWGDATGFYEPFDLGSPQLNPTDPPPFRARAVSIRTLSGGDSGSALPALATVQSTNDGPLLIISGLKIGSDQLQLSVAGKGWVKVNGEYVTVNLRNRLEENPTISALLAAFNAALLTWVARIILKRPSRSPQRTGAQDKSQRRKSKRRRKDSTRK